MRLQCRMNALHCVGRRGDAKHIRQRNVTESTAQYSKVHGQVFLQKDKTCLRQSSIAYIVVQYTTIVTTTIERMNPSIHAYINKNRLGIILYYMTLQIMVCFAYSTRTVAAPQSSRARSCPRIQSSQCQPRWEQREIPA